MTKVVTVLGLGLVMALLLAFEASAQSSCSAWNATCKSRCAQSGRPNCANYCARQMKSCRKSGCWTEGSTHGGARHCSLKKS